MTLIAAENIRASYGANMVLRDVSLSVEPGEIVTVVGPNGSGKTTLFKAISSETKRINHNLDIGD